MPAFNERETIEEIIRRVLAVPLRIERVYEVPITYDGRGYEEGKKITWKDGIVAVWTLLKYRFTE